mmetsp:Transcript_38925/g.49693  ORF Transcript_38925/g.49693 Transcript_38925/m.49693 type:complete len:185 (+) Transcript_38925:116-670(+)
MEAFGVGDLSAIDRRKTLNTGIAALTILTVCYLICSFVVASTANAGFNAVLTGLVYVAYCGGAYHVLERVKTPLGVGFLIGVTVMLTIVSLETAVFWGQLAGCEKTSVSISHYSCGNRSAYSATCAFASLLFIIQGAFAVALIAWKDEFINDDPGYQDLSEQLTAGGNEEFAYDGGYSAKSADI